MTCKELIEYLKRFAPTEIVGFLILDVDERLAYKVNRYQLIDETATMILEIADPGPMDDVVEEVTP